MTNKQAIIETAKIIGQMIYVLWGGMLVLSPFLLSNKDGLLPFIVCAASLPLFLFITFKMEGGK